MNIIITMAGIGSRFRKAGYTIPKFMIEVRGKTLFEWSMESLSDLYKEKDAKCIFVVRKEDDAKGFILEKMKKFDVSDVEVMEINELTDGQATSAMLAESYWNEDEEMVVYNIDTYVEAGGIKRADFVGDGFIPCFNVPGEHWSFVKLDESGKAVEVREKKRISNNCTIGLYYFKSAKLYKEMYDKYYANDEHMEKNEKFIAPLYNYMIENGFVVRICMIPAEKVHVLGTPEEVEIFKKAGEF